MTLANETIEVLLVGDSIASGYGLADEDGFASTLEIAVTQNCQSIKVRNFAQAGATSLSARFQIDDISQTPFDVAIVELGANDMLRGLSPTELDENLRAIIDALDKKVFLIGMRAPPSYGQDYAQSFDAVFGKIAQDYQLGFYPFLFDEILTLPREEQVKYFQSDQLHLNANGVARVITAIAPVFCEWLERVERLEP